MTNLATKTILVLHQDPLLSAGVAAALRQSPEFEIYEGTDGMATASADVVVTDYCRALLLAEEAGEFSRGPLAKARILAVTSSDREADICRALRAGIHGYLLIGGPLSELIDAVTTLAQGGRYMCYSLAQRMANSIACTPLTRRERQVLRLVVAGDSNKIIARRLGIELGTVKSHVSAIMSKLGANSRVQAASIASERGLLGTEEQYEDAPMDPRAVHAAWPPVVSSPRS